MRDISKVAKSSKAGGAACGWGGARNNVVTNALTAKQVRAIHDAADRAIACGRPFNRFVTVHWGALQIDDAHAARMTGRLIKLASDWCATKGVKMTWAWVRENDEGDGSKGSHVHIALHSPVEVPIGSLWRRWLRHLTNGKYRRGGVLSRSIGPTLSTYVNNAGLYKENLLSVLCYMSKDVTLADAANLGIKEVETTGKVIGKRAAWWQTPTSNC